ncbi:testis-specific serine/threonine-protein kinase 5-like [Ixodes scapularis]
MSQTYCGSEAYAAPEVLKGVRYLPKSADMWSLGAVLFVLVTGALPFDVENLARQVRQQMTRTVRFPRQLVATPELRNVIRTLLEPVVHLRGTMGQLVRHRWMRMYPDPLKRLAKRSLKQSREGSPVVSAMLQRPFSNIAEDGTVLASLTRQAALEDLFASDKSNLTSQVESFDWAHADHQEAQHGSLYSSRVNYTSQDVASDVWDRAEEGCSFADTGAHGKRSEPQSPKDFFASLKPDEGACKYTDDAKAGQAFREVGDPSQRLTDFASKLYHTDDHQSYDHADFVVCPTFDDDNLEAQFEALMATFKNKSTRSGTSSEPSEKSFEAGSDLLGHRSMTRTSPNK